MNQFEVPIDKQPTCDKTIDEVLKSVEFQHEHNNILVSHQIQAAKVILTYEGQ